jgi:RNA polymerase sigma-70 factor (family 1)
MDSILHWKKVVEWDDRSAFELLFREHHQDVRTFALALTRSRAMADDVTQEVFIRLWEKRAKLSHIQNFSYYLLTMVRNQSLNLLRKHKYRMEIDLDSVNMERLTFHADPESLLISSEMLGRINAVVNDLPPRCKLIFFLVKEKGLKYKEVAHLLDVSLKNVENQMGIALKRLGSAVSLIVLS